MLYTTLCEAIKNSHRRRAQLGKQYFYSQPDTGRASTLQSLCTDDRLQLEQVNQRNQENGRQEAGCCVHRLRAGGVEKDVSVRNHKVSFSTLIFGGGPRGMACFTGICFVCIWLGW